MKEGKDMLNEELSKRTIPEVLMFNNGEKVKNEKDWFIRREEIIEVLSREMYGFLPPAPKKVTVDIENRNENAFAGKAIHSKINIHFDTPTGDFSFPIQHIIPKKNKSAPLFLHIAFRPNIPDIYYPVEEILDNGFAICSFCYQDVVIDKNDGFVNGLARMYNANQRIKEQWGKISMWAFAASRVMDYLQTLSNIDKDRIAVVGHSRLGKTALWTAALDTRFSMAFSNNSGCSGAAITRGKQGEHIRDIIKNFSYWFCDHYQKYIDAEHLLPFDQHFLLSLIAPRPVYVSSASEDLWADPQSEFLSCVSSSQVYELLGLKGLVTKDEYPEPGTLLHDGQIGYHLRAGTHYLSRFDWQCFMQYMKKNKI